MNSRYALAAVAMIALASPAVAVTYTYQSQPFGFRDDTTGQWVPCASQSYAYECEPLRGTTGETGTLTISGPYPGGRIAGSTLLLEVFDMPFYLQTGRGDQIPCTVLGQYCTVYTVTTAGGSTLTGHNSGRATYPFAQATGYISNFIGGTVDSGYYYLTFGRRGEVTGWSGFNYNGGDFDPDTYGDGLGGGGDSFKYGAYTLGPGTWSGAAAEVPIPAPAALLGAAIIAMAGFRSARRLAVA